MALVPERCLAGRSKPGGYFFLNGRGRACGIWSVSDGPSHDDVIGPGLERGLHIHGSFLVVSPGLRCRADAGDDDAKPVRYRGTNSSGLVTGTDDAGAPDTLGPTGSRQDDGPNVGFKAEIFHVRPVETRENGDGQDSEIALGGIAGCTEDRIVAVYGDEIHVPGPELSDSGTDGLRNIEEFEVGKHLLVFGAKPVGQLEVPSGKKKLQADLVEGNGIGQRVDDLSRLGGGWNIQREDQPVGRGDCL